MGNIVNRQSVKKRRGRSRNCVLFLEIISASPSSSQKAPLPAYRRETLPRNKLSTMAGALDHLVV